jgi:hypothetical protein
MATQTFTTTEGPIGPPIAVSDKAIDVSTHAYLQSQDTSVLSLSHLRPHCHHLEKQVTQEVNAYFLEHWPFPDERTRKKFVNAGFSTVTCWYFPKALDDRIHFACRLLTLLFLIDGPYFFSYKANPMYGLLIEIQTCLSTCPSQKGKPIITS